MGRELIRNADFEVIPFGRDDWSNLEAKFSNNIDVVVHAASDLRTPASVSPTTLLDSNIITTARIIEAVKRHRIPRLIYISSCAVYGEDRNSSEDVQCCPISINGISKLLNEKVIAEFFQGTSIQFTILRVFNMYGGDDRFSIFSHIRHALENTTPFLLNKRGIAQRDFIHVSDVSKCILQLLKQKVQYKHLNIGTGVATRISDLIDLIKIRNPNLIIQHTDVTDTEYSRANIGRLSEFVKFRFYCVKDYLKSGFMS